MIEKFDSWNKLKKELNGKNKEILFKDSDIWWAKIGNNLKIEINGKGEKFTISVLVLKKLSKTDFIGIPLSSKIKTGTGFYNYNLHGKDYTALLNQIKMMNSIRLTNRIGQLDEKDFEYIKNKLRNLLNL